MVLSCSACSSMFSMLAIGAAAEAAFERFSPILDCLAGHTVTRSISRCSQNTPMSDGMLSKPQV